MSKVLLIEDERTLSEALQRVLTEEGYDVVAMDNASQGLAAANRNDFHVVVTDWKMPNGNGMEVVRTLHRDKPHVPVILMTGHHTTEAAIEAMKLGAYDYIVKPFDAPEFLELVGKAVSNSRLMSEPVEMGEATFAKDAIVGSSRGMQNVYKQIGQIAEMPVTVLIRGETGTGKELVARAIYQHSDRAQQPFIEVNCVAIPENLLESELFGHEPGAFTDAKARRIGRFEQANKGTIFLDEIGDMSPSTQAKLLRVLQNQLIQRLGGKDTIAVDVRVLAATHRDLEVAIQEKQFREDLYHRLNHFVISLPPLRERSEDIPELVRFFVQRYGAELDSPNARVAPEAMVYLQQQSWSGNVRELRNIVRKSLLMARGYTITREIVDQALAQTAPPRPAGDQTLVGYIAELLAKAERGELEKVQDILTDELERELYAQAIRLAKGDQKKAAAWIGVSRPTIREKLLKFGLHRSQDERLIGENLPQPA